MKQSLMLFALLLPLKLHAAMAGSVTQYGITWYFDGAYETGTFANGDYWVAGPVVIDSITPHFTGTGNGWEVNPMPTVSAHGFKVGCYRNAVFDPSLVPDLPYTAGAGESIVKAVDNGTESRPCLQKAAVLTVLGSVPPDNGATVFRPPYIGTDKPLYSVNDLHTELLPTLAKPAVPNDLDAVVERYKMMQFDHFGRGLKQGMRAEDNLPGYGGDIGLSEGVAAVSLMLDDPLEDKMPALIRFVQCGIDYHHMTLQDIVVDGETIKFNWPGGGGEDPCHTLPWVFAAYILDNEDMKDYIKAHNTDFLYNDFRVQVSRNGVAVFGETEKIETPEKYWNTVETITGDKTQADPYGYIDGGPEPGTSYQFCCTTQPWKGQMLAFHLMPGMKELWWNRALSDYIDRWVDFGIWSQPDPCAPLSQGGGVHPTRPGECVLDPDLKPGSTFDDFECQDGKECGRFPELHGTMANGGIRSSNFIHAMWNEYRETASAVSPLPVRASAAVTALVTPNPVRTRAVFHLKGYDAVKIFDNTGELTYAAVKDPGRVTLQWDGRGTDGRITGPGLYFYRTASGATGSFIKTE